MIQIQKLLLSNFRNFSSRRIEFSSPSVLLVGANGAGKTNILESLTLLGRSASLRGGDFDEMIKISEKNFTIYAEISNHEFIEKIAVSFDAAQKKKFYLLMANQSVQSVKAILEVI